MPRSTTASPLGADGLEIDVQLSSDGIPVVIHDHTLDRTTDRTGPVSALTAAELARVDAGFPFRDRRRASLSRPGHRRAAARRRAGETSGHAHHHRDERRPAGAGARGGASIRRAGAVDRICVGSFHQSSIDTLRAEAPEIVTSASQQEARWTLHRSWVRWPWIGRAAVCRVPGARVRRPHARGVAGVHPAGPSRRPGAAGVGGQRARRHPALVRLGRRRDNLGSARRRRAASTAAMV